VSYDFLARVRDWRFGSSVDGCKPTMLDRTVYVV